MERTPRKAAESYDAKARSCDNKRKFNFYTEGELIEAKCRGKSKWYQTTNIGQFAINWSIYYNHDYHNNYLPVKRIRHYLLNAKRCR